LKPRSASFQLPRPREGNTKEKVSRMAQAAQMNCRIDAALKAAGDSVLAEAGVTPSRIVRMTWNYLAGNRHVPDAVPRLVRFLESDARSDNPTAADSSSQDELRAAEEAIMAGPALIEQFFSDMGVSPKAVEPRPYSVAKQEAYAEKYGQRFQTAPCGTSVTGSGAQ